MAIDKNSMAVGHIPSLTWHRIKMNEGLVPADYQVGGPAGTAWRLAEPAGGARHQEPAGLGEGVTLSAVPVSLAEQELKKIAPKEAPERFVAGKIPIYHPQSFGTGLGAELDEALLVSDPEADLVDVAAGTEVSRPIKLTVTAWEGRAQAAAQVLHMGAGSKAALLIESVSEGSPEAEGRSILTVSTRIVMDEGAELTLVKAQTLGEDFLSLDDLGVSMAAGAKLDLVVAELGAAQSFRGIQVEQNGEDAVLTGSMGYLAAREQKVDINYNVIQRGKRTQSTMNFDGVLAGKGEKSFRGTIDFRNGAVGAFGDEQENVLLLSPDIVNKTLPVILCEEEDVEGRHGATVGRLSEDMLFYMASRDIDEKTAEQIMVRARLGAVVRRIPDEEMSERLMEFVEEAFADESLS